MLNSGDILEGKYEVIKVLGKGGMGVVYLCKDTTLLNLWAIKEVINETKHIDILAEANILKDLNHSGIRRVVDVFYENNNLYMVQDYVEGQTLKEYVRVNGKMQTERVCQVISQLCDIVGYLHSQDPVIIYRDIKPSNIIITTSGKVILIDFGISKIYKNDTEKDIVCAGSNGYAAPEQYGLGKCCTQTDIYGIGMLVYFMVKGRDPHTGIEPLLDENYEINVDDNFKELIQKCIQIGILDRYTSVEVLKKEVLEVLNRDKYEKVAVLNDCRIKTCPLTKKLNNRVLSKVEFEKTITRFIFVIIAILASVYILYGNKKENMDGNTADIPSTVKALEGSSSVENSSIGLFEH